MAERESPGTIQIAQFDLQLSLLAGMLHLSPGVKIVHVVGFDTVGKVVRLLVKGNIPLGASLLEGETCVPPVLTLYQELDPESGEWMARWAPGEE